MSYDSRGGLIVGVVFIGHAMLLLLLKSLF